MPDPGIFDLSVTSIETVDTFNDDEVVVNLDQGNSLHPSMTKTPGSAPREELPLPQSKAQISPEFQTYKVAKEIQPNEFLGFLDNGILSKSTITPTTKSQLEDRKDTKKVRRSDSKTYDLYKTVMGKMFRKDSINITQNNAKNDYIAQDTIHTSSSNKDHEIENQESTIVNGNNCAQDPVLVRYLLCVMLFLVYNGVLIGALFYSIENNLTIHWCHDVGFLLSISIVLYTFILYKFLFKRFLGNSFRRNVSKPVLELFGDLQVIAYLPWTLGAALIISVVAFLIVDTQHQRQRMISLLGVAIALILAGLFSQKHSRIKWRLVGFAMTFNFLLCLISFRYPMVADGLGCLLEKSQSLMRIPQFGATFLLERQGLIQNSDSVLARRMLYVNYTNDLLPTTWNDFEREVHPLNQSYTSVFLTSMISIYFVNFIAVAFQRLGVTHWLIGHVGGLGRFFLGVSRLEALAMVAFMFLGPLEAPLFIQAHMEDLTQSELFSIYILGLISLHNPAILKDIYMETLGLNRGELAVISLVGIFSAMALAKLLKPENNEDKINTYSIKRQLESHYQKNKENLDSLNVVDAALRPDLSMGYVTGRMFQPFAWFLGIDWDHCEMVSGLVMTRLFRTDVMVLKKLVHLFRTQVIEMRTFQITLFTITNNVNIAGYAIVIASLGSLAPNRRIEIISLSGRCLAAAFLSTFLTGCLIGTVVN
ncbi:hypothetical protein TCAL_12510 [Tigriopus californicus]|uniref:Concentrative nucleoside transporter C-terminal domain-containing protein n=1 Tax=Tigriopus californicus TaxID=6832 RepID=A0A553PHK2_TIGCA|nr:hypothetical protein TCAL_12510 [Tigriopus californicus]